MPQNALPPGWFILPVLLALSPAASKGVLGGEPAGAAGVPVGGHNGQGFTEVRILRGHRGRAFGVAVTPDGRRVLTTGLDGTLRIWDLNTGRELSQIQAHKDWAVGLAVCPDGKRAVTGGNDKTARLWDLETGKELRRFEGHGGHVWTVAVSADGKRLLSGSHDKTVRLWDLETGKELRRFECPNVVWGAALSPDGKRVLAPASETVRLLNAATGAEERTLQVNPRGNAALAFSPDGKRALSGGGGGLLFFWELETGKQLLKLDGHAHAAEPAKLLLRFVAFSPDGKRAATTGYDTTVRLWDLEAGTELARYDWRPENPKEYMLFGVAFTPDGRRVVAAGGDGLVRVLEINVKPAPVPTTVPPKPGPQTFAQNWNSSWGPMPIQVHGNTATGTYTKSCGLRGPGTFTGTLTGNVLHAQWKDNDGKAHGTFTMTLTDDHHFTMNWQTLPTTAPGGPGTSSQGKDAPPGGGEVALAVTGPPVAGELLTVTATVRRPAKGQTLKLELPAGLERVKGGEVETVPPPSAGKDTSLIAWQVRPARPGQYVVAVRSGSAPPTTQAVAVQPRPDPAVRSGSAPPTIQAVAAQPRPDPNAGAKKGQPFRLDYINVKRSYMFFGPDPKVDKLLFNPKEEHLKSGKFEISVSRAYYAHKAVMTVEAPDTVEDGQSVTIKATADATWDLTPKEPLTSSGLEVSIGGGYGVKGDRKNLSATPKEPFKSGTYSLKAQMSDSVKVGDNLRQFFGGYGPWPPPEKDMEYRSFALTMTTNINGNIGRIDSYWYYKRPKAGKIDTKPDLKPGRVDVLVAGGKTAGEPSTVTATVHNPAKGQTVRLELPAGMERVAGREVETVPLPPAGQHTSVVTWTVKASRPGQYVARVHSGSSVSQSPPVTIQSPPVDRGKLAGLDLDGPLKVGQVFTVTASVASPLPGQTVSLTLPPGLERVEGPESQPLPGLPGGQTAGVSKVAWKVKLREPGHYDISVKASNGPMLSRSFSIDRPPDPNAGKWVLALPDQATAGKAFAVTARVTNPLPNQALTLSLAPKLERLEGPERQPVPSGGGEQTVSWKVKALEPGRFSVRVRSSTGSEQEKSMTIRPAKEGYTLLDAQRALKMWVGMIPEELELDVDGSGHVDSHDAVLILQMAGARLDKQP